MQKPPILFPPVHGKLVIMYIIMLEDSMGCVLEQNDEIDRKERDMYYLSKKFTNCETKYSIL